MYLLSDILTYIRRIIKSPSNAVITDALLIDYVNRFYTSDVDARMQLFDLKTKYQFQTTPTVDQYNMPLYSVQTEQGGQNISWYPVYQGFTGPAYINGIQVPLQTQKNSFYNIWPKVTQQLATVAVGDGGNTYSFNIPIVSNYTNVPNNPPLNGLLRGHIDITGIIAIGDDPPMDPPITSSFITGVPTTSVDSAFFITSIDGTGANVVVQDSGQFLTGNVNCGLLMQPGPAPFGNQALAGGYSANSNTVNYLTGQVNVTFPAVIPVGNDINVQCYFFETGLPRAILFYNNVLTLRSPPDTQYLVELDAYLSPAAFLTSSSAVPFGYMSEYIARGAARKILSDTGDVEQFNFYEPMFREQEMLVWKRSQRQFTTTRTETIYSQGFSQGLGQNNLNGGSML
jgi:hypothetical protein